MVAVKSARGVVYVHSSPPAVCPHVEWAVARVLDSPARLPWTPQPADPSTVRAECTWSGRPGTGSALASALRQWPMIRFEITEEPSPGVDGERIMYAPGRGIFRSAMSANGDVMIGEDRLRAALATVATHRPEALAHHIDKLLGSAWDAELEIFRHAADGAGAAAFSRVG